MAFEIEPGRKERIAALLKEEEHGTPISFLEAHPLPDTEVNCGFGGLFVVTNTLLVLQQHAEGGSYWKTHSETTLPDGIVVGALGSHAYFGQWSEWASPPKVIRQFDDYCLGKEGHCDIGRNCVLQKIKSNT